MSPDAADSLLHYRLVEKIGEGGMGQVWRATDTTLGREVAIKILPAAFAGDVDRVARFEREARVLASLNHPNVAAIHGVHEDQGLRFLALELVPGEDLAERIARGPVPVPEALSIAKAIAEALEYAHDRGVVHRDLKPANVKLTPEGQVKVLDFGLAKAMTADASENPGGPSLSPTLTSAGTVAGMILGTASYMSPEQAKGKTVDRRADIWSFGVVLFEMLTGRSPYAQETISETLASVLMSEPPLDALSGAAPPQVLTLLRRCLEKDPRQRLRDIGEARVAIGEVLAGGIEPVAPRGAVVSPRGPAWRWAVAGLLAGILVTTLLALRAPRTEAPVPAHVLMALAPAAGLQIGASLGEASFALSPDGRTLCFVGLAVDGNSDSAPLWVRRLDRTQAVAIPGTERAANPFFSPDGRTIGFLRGGSILTVAIEGGPVDTLFAADQEQWVGSASWGESLDIVFHGGVRQPDGEIRTGLWSIAPGGATPKSLLLVDSSGDSGIPEWPAALVGGRGVLFTRNDPENEPKVMVEVLSLADGSTRTLLPGFHPTYLPTGHLLYTLDGRLFAVPFDARRLELTGNPRVMVEGLVVDTIVGHSLYAASRSGDLVYISKNLPRVEDANLLWVKADGTSEALGAPAAAYVDPRLSPDGTLLAFSLPTEGNEIWVRDLERQTQTRLTFDPGEDETPVWSPDARWIVYASNRPGQNRLIHRRRPDGAGTEEVLWSGAEHVHVSGWTPDGTALILDVARDQGFDVWALELGASSRPRTLLGDRFNELHARISPDGRWLAYSSDASGRSEVYVQPYPDLDRKLQVSNGGGSQPVWARSGRELFYREGPRMLAVDFQPAEGRASLPRVVFDHDYGWGKGSTHFSYDVAPDGRFVMTLSDTAYAPREVNLVLGWSRELERHGTD